MENSVKTTFLVLLTFLCSAPFLNAQNAPGKNKITGKVFDESLIPVKFATVTLVTGPDSATLVKGSLTNENGQYFFEGIPPGKYWVKVSATSRKSKVSAPVNVADSVGEFTVGDVLIEKKLTVEAGVTVTARKQLIEQRIDKTVVNIENSSLATGNSVYEILRQLPGVVVDKDGNISMKGKTGVSILVDGKLTYLSGDQLVSLLKSMQAGSVQTIELVSNPSAKYDASGSAGLINIRLKRSRSYGLNGTLTGDAGYGKNFKASTGILLNYRTKSFNIYGNYNYDNNRMNRELNIDRISLSTGKNTYFGQKMNALLTSQNNTFRIGADYYINKKSILGIMVNGYANTGKDHAISNTDIGSNGMDKDSAILADNTTNKTLGYATGNINYKLSIDSLGQELNIDVDYARYNNKVKNIYNNYFTNPDGSVLKPPVIFRSNTPVKVSIFSAKIDYTYPLNNKVKLDVGLKSSVVKTDNDILFENLNNANSTWVSDPGRTNYFQYTENINAAYLNFRITSKFAEMQVGLRGEHTQSKGNSVTTLSIVKRSYFSLFPSFFIRKKLSDDHNLGFTYTRRVDRPNYVTLNPFVYNFDLYTFEKGNPYLNPQFNNSYQLSYSFKDKLQVTLGFSQTNDAITEVSFTDTANKTLVVGKQNLAKQRTYYMNASYPLKIAKWWDVYTNLNVYRLEFNSPDLFGAPFSSGRAAYDFNINQNISLGNATTVDLSVNYLSERVYGTYFIKPIYSADVGIRKEFAHKKLTVKLAAYDLFNTHRERINTVLPNQDYRIYQKFETQVFRISCSYRFGSAEIKAMRQRAKGSDNEERRVKT